MNTKTTTQPNANSLNRQSERSTQRRDRIGAAFLSGAILAGAAIAEVVPDKATPKDPAVLVSEAKKVIGESSVGKPGNFALVVRSGVNIRSSKSISKSPDGYPSDENVKETISKPRIYTNPIVVGDWYAVSNEKGEIAYISAAIEDDRNSDGNKYGEIVYPQQQSAEEAAALNQGTVSTDLSGGLVMKHGDVEVPLARGQVVSGEEAIAAFKDSY